ncbi:MAG: hypothetical protein QOE31_3670 [Solirubrobacteraceae bacterium]|nr:hypothetical protein [Solirubrobacteraceae bacterium]
MAVPPKPKAKKKAAKVVCKRVRVKGSKKRFKRVCKPVKKKKVVAKKPPITTAPPATPAIVPAARAPVPVAPSPAAPPVTTPPDPGPVPPVVPPSAPGLPVFSGTFGVREAQRLLWRAGFGPRPGDAEALAQMGVLAAVRSLTRPAGDPTLVGAPVTIADPYAPRDAWGHDHLWMLDRFVRSDQPLVERMVLIFHDWFATSNADVGNAGRMIDQAELLRAHALGSFTDLVRDITTDPAMLIFLSGIENRRNAINENYAREVMELFTLGADRGAYTETDVRELARALTGWRADWQDPVGFVNFRYDATRADTGTKTLWQGTAYQRSGAFDYRDLGSLVLENPYHRSFFVLKLWSYFVPTPPSPATLAALEDLYVSSGRSIAQVVEAILLHPDVYLGAPLVKPPAVYNAGLLRATGQTITTDDWAWIGDMAGQHLFYPPNVSGWNDRAWLDTSRLMGRWFTSTTALLTDTRLPQHYSGSTETGTQALATALAYLCNPALTPESAAVLQALADQPAPAGFDAATFRAHRQNMLRQLIATSPDYQVC